MSYIDGFVAAVPAAGKEAYRDHCRIAAAVFLEHGATRVVDAWGDDVPPGKVTDFYRAVQATDGEVVVFSWIEWPSREARDAAMEKVMTDPRLDPAANPMPFDGKRMIFGGFAPLNDAGR